MNASFATDGMALAGNGRDAPTTSAEFNADLGRTFQLLDLAARRLDLLRRIRIAKIRMEHGMLTIEAMEELLIEGAELAADIQLWKAYR